MTYRIDTTVNLTALLLRGKSSDHWITLCFFRIMTNINLINLNGYGFDYVEMISFHRGRLSSNVIFTIPLLTVGTTRLLNLMQVRLWLYWLQAERRRFRCVLTMHSRVV